MNDRVLNEKESLELIAQMIQNTKSRMTRNSGAPFLIWGIYDHNSVVIGLVSVEGNGKLSLAMAVVFVAGYFPAFYFMD